MLYISPQNEYPRHVGDIKVANPEWEPEFGLPTGWIHVQQSEPPTLVDGKVLQELFPQEIDGVWTQVWTTRDMTAEELAVRDAPVTARQRLVDLGFSEQEIQAISRGLV